jgi:hypothetical protein
MRIRKVTYGRDAREFVWFRELLEGQNWLQHDNEPLDEDTANTLSKANGWPIVAEDAPMFVLKDAAPVAPAPAPAPDPIP